MAIDPVMRIRRSSPNLKNREQRSEPQTNASAGDVPGTGRRAAFPRWRSRRPGLGFGVHLYQGQLQDAGQPASGLYDLQFCLFDTPNSALPLACVPDLADVPVEAGLFAVTLDFGTAPFVGQQRYLELRVRPGASSGSYTVLAPRQLIRPAPEALRSNVSAAAPWSGLTGVPAGFADGIDNEGVGTVTSVAAGTGLSGGIITGSGTIGIANNGVGSTQIADGSVAAVDVAPDSLGATQLATNAVTAAELADDAVDTNAVQNLAITQGKLATGAVGSAQLAAGAVGTAQINAAQVQARVGGTCAAGEYFRGINADGSVACEPVPGVPRITTVHDPANSVGLHTDIAIGADGLPVISYFDDTANTLKLARCANAACTGTPTINTVDDPPSNIVGQFTSIAVGTDGLPVISYRDDTAGALKVAKCQNAACTGAFTFITTVDDLGDVGWHTSIAIDADGRPVISYFDNTANTLKVAKCADAACFTATITIVDDPANEVGLYTSIAIGADGWPVISYYDLTAGDLKLAKCDDAACQAADDRHRRQLGQQRGSVHVDRHRHRRMAGDQLPRRHRRRPQGRQVHQCRLRREDDQHRRQPGQRRGPLQLDRHRHQRAAGDQLPRRHG